MPGAGGQGLRTDCCERDEQSSKPLPKAKVIPVTYRLPEGTDVTPEACASPPEMNSYSLDAPRKEKLQVIKFGSR